ncbi:MAG: hypothetical protein ACQEP8_01875 [Chlamydiota bacterium]
MKKIALLAVIAVLAVSCQSYKNSRKADVQGREAFRDHALMEVAQQYESNEFQL